MWMDEILHHLETMGNHNSLVCTGESSFQGLLGGADFVHPQYELESSLCLSCKVGWRSRSQNAVSVSVRDVCFDYTFLGVVSKGNQAFWIFA